MQAILKNPYVSMLLTGWHYAGELRGRYLFIYSLFVLDNLLNALVPIIWGLFINQIQLQGSSIIRSAWMYVGAVLVLHFVGWALHGNGRVLERKLAFQLSRNYLQELYHKTLHLPVQWHQDHHSGSTINRVRKAYEALRKFFENSFRHLHALSKFLLSFGAMVYFSPLFGLIAIVLGAVAIWTILKFDKPFIKALDETNEREHEVSANLFDSLSNILTVITLRLERQMEGGLGKKVDQVFPPFKRKVLINEWKWFTVDTIVVFIYAIILLGYIYQNYVPGEVFLVGGLVTLVSFVDRFTSVFHDVAYLYTDIVQQHTDVQTANTIFEAYEREHRPENQLRLPQTWQTIELENLRFQHQVLAETRIEKPGLYDLYLRINRGERIALIGPSGSGKSTLLALMRGLYEGKPGSTVKVDGKTAGSLELLSNHITLFPQEPEIFENTIEFNITLGLPFSREIIQEVCDVARFTEVLQQLPQGLDSKIQEKGVNLSGGQKQRLALARGILAARESDLILLDEPTSSVDPKTELEIYRRLFEEFKGKAVLSSLHRLHLLTLFDYVYVMKNGRIVDEGRFVDLRISSPDFQEMWRHQEEALQ